MTTEIRQIVVGFADVPTAREATRQAATLAAALGVGLHVVSALETDETVVLDVGTDHYELSDSTGSEGVIQNFLAALDLELRYTVAVREGEPARMILAEAERVNADLIVVGNVRMQGVGRFLGSVGTHVLHHATCNVMIVKTA